MPRLMPMHWRDIEVILFRLGCTLTRQSASHRIYGKEGSPRPVVLNVHGKKLIQVDVIARILRTVGSQEKIFYRCSRVGGTEVASNGGLFFWLT